MVKTLSLNTEVPPNRELKITLPSDVPVGPAEIVVVVASQAGAPTRTLGDLRRSEFFGMYRDRTDIEGVEEFASRVRKEAWSRPE
jgi:hypothetical protein